MGKNETGSDHPLRVVGYIRVSTTEQAESGAGMQAQRDQITAECERRGWHLATILEDAGISAKSTKGRDGLATAIALCEAGGADVVMATKVDRIARSLIDFCGLMDRSEGHGWTLIALDAPFDTRTPQGRAMAQVLGVFAEMERRVIGQRTRDALAVKRTQGIYGGRPSTIPTRVRERIARQRAEGLSYAAIADSLNLDAIPTGQGGRRWYPSTVRSVFGGTVRPAVELG